jgi:hypothetical protein
LFTKGTVQVVGGDSHLEVESFGEKTWVKSYGIKPERICLNWLDVYD